jgi:hypothetical protein
LAKEWKREFPVFLQQPHPRFAQILTPRSWMGQYCIQFGRELQVASEEGLEQQLSGKRKVRVVGFEFEQSDFDWWKARLGFDF